MIIADTGFWLALANRRDKHHQAATRALGRIKEPLITTWPVLTETCHMLVTRIGVDAELAFIKSARDGACEVFELTGGQWPRIHELMEHYRDLPMDLADASLVLLAEHLETGKILSTDTRDFATYRWKNHKPFRNVLLS